jgi:hypothetical protein
MEASNARPMRMAASHGSSGVSNNPIISSSMFLLLYHD